MWSFTNNWTGNIASWHMSKQNLSQTLLLFLRVVNSCKIFPAITTDFAVRLSDDAENLIVGDQGTLIN